MENLEFKVQVTLTLYIKAENAVLAKESAIEKICEISEILATDKINSTWDDIESKD